MAGGIVSYFSVEKDFSQSPIGRYPSDSDASGEALRKKLMNNFSETDFLIIDLDNDSGYSTSFLEEAFGGLIRVEGYSSNELEKYFMVITSYKDNEIYVEEVNSYLGW